MFKLCWCGQTIAENDPYLFSSTAYRGTGVWYHWSVKNKTREWRETMGRFIELLGLYRERAAQSVSVWLRDMQHWAPPIPNSLSIIVEINPHCCLIVIQHNRQNVYVNQFLWCCYGDTVGRVNLQNFSWIWNQCRCKLMDLLQLIFCILNMF